MAAETSSLTPNGDYGTVNGAGYSMKEQTYDTHATNHTMSSQTEYANTTVSSTSGTAGTAEISKEEVGWYFVEQYYTTLSKSPGKLYLFYTKHSQFVTGVETEKVSVCVGQRAISEKIKNLDIQDCKVRVTNVDSQASRNNIVIQVIGEISNKSQPKRKFTQTFVLAEQTNGYFVLNDIFRYIIDEDEYEPEGEEPQQPIAGDEAAGGYQEPASTTEDTAPAGLTSSQDPAAQEHDASLVDRELEQAAEVEPQDTAAPAGAVNGDIDAPSADVVVAEDTPAAATTTDEPESSTTVDVAQSTPEVPSVEPEKPQDPEPTPAVSPPKAATQSAAPAKPTGPKSWASMVAGGQTRVAPAMPAAAPAQPAAKAAAVPTAPAPQVAPTPTAPAAFAAAQQIPEAVTPTSTGSEWQTAGHDHKRQQSRAQGQHGLDPGARGYIKNVTDDIEPRQLREALEKVAQIQYLDISRAKRCAFVDFTTATQYQAAIDANPIEVNGQALIVEERRIRPNVPGNFPTRGRGNFNRGGPPRGGGGRGGFRGARGGPQAA